MMPSGATVTQYRQIKYRQMVLTGATGALGPALAAELVQADAADRVAVLMRCPPTELTGRFNRWLDAVRPLLPSDFHAGLARLFPVAGDVSQDRLGLADDDALRRETDVVIHAAADTNFAAPPDRQWDINVEGTRRTLAWAADCPTLQRFLLVSSVFVSGSRTGRIHETTTAEPPPFVTYYQRTKWEAEKVALASGLPIGVARISLILGSHATGGVHRPGAVHSLIKWFARGLVPLVPGLPDARGDLIATETAAQCLARAVMADWPAADAPAGPPIWHIAAGDAAPRMTELIDFVYQHFAARPAWRRKQIPRPQLVELETFDQFIASVDAAGRTTLAQTLRSANRFLPDLAYPKTYETKQAEALWGGPLPQYDWRETMDRVLHFCCPPASPGPLDSAP
jgi:nucleoside-diphosphate-sugar epimerase